MMKHPTRVPCQIELQEGTPAKLVDLPRFLAAAMHGFDPELADAEAAIRVDLTAMVVAGTLEVLDPSTLKVQTRPNAKALRGCVVMPHKLQPLLERLNIELQSIAPSNGPRFWTIGNAARSIALQHGFDEPARGLLREQMMAAAVAGELEVLHPRREQIFLPVESRDWYDLVTPSRVNAWLDKTGASYQWGEPLVFPVSKSLEPWFKSSISDWPEGLRVTYLHALGPHFDWDNAEEATRRRWAADYDAAHDPAHEADRNAGFELVTLLHELDDEERNLKLMRVGTPLEHESLQRQLLGIATKREALNSKLTDLDQGIEEQRAETLALDDIQRGFLSVLVIAGMLSDLRELVGDARKPMTEKVIAGARVGAFPVFHRILRAPIDPPMDIDLEHMARVTDVLRWFNKGNEWPVLTLVVRGRDGGVFQEYSAPMASDTDADIKPADPSALGSKAELAKSVQAAAVPMPSVVDGHFKEDRGARVKRAALIERSRRHWPSIERDLKDGSSNGLSTAAKADTHGFWWEGDAIKWAEARDKWKTPEASQAAFASVVHRIAG